MVMGKLTEDAAKEIKASAVKHGIDAAFLQAILVAESVGDWAKNQNSVHTASIGWIHPYVGLTEGVARAHGIDFWSVEKNRALQIDALAKILHDLYVESINTMVAQKWFRGDPGLSVDSATTSNYLRDIEKFTKLAKAGA